MIEHLFAACDHSELQSIYYGHAHHTASLIGAKAFLPVNKTKKKKR